MKSTHIQVSSYTNLMWGSRSILSCTRNSNIRPVYASQIKKLRKSFLVEPAPCRPVLTPISCTKLTIHSAHAESPIVPKQVFFLLCWQFGMCDQSMLHRSRNSGRDFWWNQLPCWPVLTPTSCTKLKIHSVMKTVLVLKQVLIFHLFCGTKSMLHRSRNSGRDFWWNQLPCGPVLTPISCTKFKIHSAYEDSPIVPKQVFFSCACNLECGTRQSFTDQETQEEIFGGTSFLVGQFLHPSPVQAQDPFSAYRQSNCS